ncbi:hypothetical protein [Streptomyces sp. NPDC006510]|uniref:hypothetical protein n=1 Tax=Streptomyces sp. NPDC006510 TaxID=3155600 RepID=UPI0033A43B1E
MTTEFGPLTVPSQNGFRAVMAVGAGATLVAFAIAFFLPGRGSSAPAAARPVPEAASAPEPAGS